MMLFDVHRATPLFQPPRLALVRLVVLVACAVFAGLWSDQAAADDEPPRVFILDGQVLAANRQRAMDADPAMRPAVAHLVRAANAQLRAGPFSVTDKQEPAPSGDLHDYQSIGPYWWPDPDQPDGLPYIRRDGQTNPERSAVGDARRYSSMTSAVTTLANAWYFTGDERYAQRAALLLRTWYLDPATRMNPNMQYAQAIPGRTDGRGIGIVDASQQPRIIDAIGMLQGSDAWTAEDQQGMVQWFDAFLDWLLTSENGRDESQTRNNHATQYDVQVVSYALFVGRQDVALSVLRAVQEQRVATQVLADGTQPLELARTRSWGYSCYNALHLARLAALGRHCGVDLWQRDPDGPDVGDAIDYLVPFAMGEQDWPHRNIRELDPQSLCEPMLLGLGSGQARRYGQCLRTLVDETSVLRLLYPIPE